MCLSLSQTEKVIQNKKGTLNLVHQGMNQVLHVYKK